MAINIGTAGWTIPREVREEFPAEGSSLERYASRFPVTEINSSFHRSHRQQTWERWHDSVPAGFRFSVKLPKLITHQHKLVDCPDAVATFLEEIRPLGDKRAVLLVQLPPKLAFDEGLAGAFFQHLRSASPAAIACEPRHPSWFSPEADALLTGHHIMRVAADPALNAEAARPGGWRGMSYWRLHGSPAMYRSSYADRIDELAQQLAEDAREDREVWCIFDNTASSAAAQDAIALRAAVRS